METIWLIGTGTSHILFNVVSIPLAGYNWICKTGDGKRFFYPLLLVFVLIMAVSQPLYAYLSGVTYGDSTFVTVGERGTILASPDGVTWTERTSDTSSYLNGVAYGNSTFVAVGDGGTILTSPHGVAWTER